MTTKRLTARNFMRAEALARAVARLIETDLGPLPGSDALCDAEVLGEMLVAEIAGLTERTMQERR